MPSKRSPPNPHRTAARRRTPRERRPRRTYDHDALRDSIVAIVQQHPGINKKTLHQSLRVPWSTVGEHLNVLLRGGRVMGAHMHRQLVLYPPGMDREEARRLAVLRDPVAKRILQELARSPGQRAADLGRATGLPRMVLRRGLGWLEENDLLERHGGHHPRLHAARGALREARSLAEGIADADAAGDLGRH